MKHPSTSLTLLDLARQGDDEAWTDLRMLYTPLIYFWCRESGVEASGAEEVLWNVLGSAYPGLKRFKHNGRTGAFRKWLRTITKNEIADWANGLAYVDVEVLARPADSVDEETSPSVETTILYHSAWQLVRDEFSARDQDVFRRIVENGEASKDVAEDMKLSRPAVYTVVNRIKARLRERFPGEIADT